MGQPRFELGSKRPKRSRMDQATLLPLVRYSICVCSILIERIVVSGAWLYYWLVQVFFVVVVLIGVGVLYRCCSWRWVLATRTRIYANHPQSRAYSPALSSASRMPFGPAPASRLRLSHIAGRGRLAGGKGLEGIGCLWWCRMRFVKGKRAVFFFNVSEDLTDLTGLNRASC